MLGHRPEHHVLLPTLTKLGATMKITVNATTATHLRLTKPCLSVFTHIKGTFGYKDNAQRECHVKIKAEMER